MKLIISKRLKINSDEVDFSINTTSMQHTMRAINIELNWKKVISNTRAERENEKEGGKNVIN